MNHDVRFVQRLDLGGRALLRGCKMGSNVFAARSPPALGTSCHPGDPKPLFICQETKTFVRDLHFCIITEPKLSFKLNACLYNHIGKLWSLSLTKSGEIVAGFFAPSLSLCLKKKSTKNISTSSSSHISPHHQKLHFKIRQLFYLNHCCIKFGA